MFVVLLVTVYSWLINSVVACVFNMFGFIFACLRCVGWASGLWYCWCGFVVWLFRFDCLRLDWLFVVCMIISLIWV